MSGTYRVYRHIEHVNEYQKEKAGSLNSRFRGLAVAMTRGNLKYVSQGGMGHADNFVRLKCYVYIRS